MSENLSELLPNYNLISETTSRTRIVIYFLVGELPRTKVKVFPNYFYIWFESSSYKNTVCLHGAFNLQNTLWS